MKTKSTLRAALLALTAFFAFATIVFAQTNGALSLLIHGSVASTDVRIIDGHVYVPLKDIAKAYHQTLLKRPDGYELTDEGVASLDTDTAASRSGDWSLSVTGVDQVLSYTPHYDPSGTAVAPAGADDGLVVINCRVVNGSGAARTFGLSNYFTTLTDDQANPHKPLAFDAASIHAVGSFRGVTVPAHGSCKLAIVFSVSQESAPKTFSFSLMDLSAAGFDTAHRKDLRIPLQ